MNYQRSQVAPNQGLLRRASGDLVRVVKLYTNGQNMSLFRVPPSVRSAPCSSSDVRSAYEDSVNVG